MKPTKIKKGSHRNVLNFLFVCECESYAIAFAVLKHLETMDCRVLFSTHYHKLTDEFGDNSSQQKESWGTHPKIALGHMACKEEK
jgi:DNA mismatch repair ATPase MutS